ncbi:MAG TPA: hypothetical protein V6D47_13505, partial [Oscillatoriaceae cyanobacterium]
GVTVLASLRYVYPVEKLGAGVSFGNLDTFARVSRESDLQGLWSAWDDEHYAGDLTTRLFADGAALVPSNTTILPHAQSTAYAVGEVTATKTFFVPLETDALRTAYTRWRVENHAPRAIALEWQVDLRWNAMPSPYHAKAPTAPQTEKVVASRLDGPLLLAETVRRPYTRLPNFFCPPGVEALGNPSESRVFGAKRGLAALVPHECRVLAPSRVKLRYRLVLEPGAETTLDFVLTFSPEGLTPAQLAWTAADAANAEARAIAAADEQRARATLFTPDATINRGLQWAKLNTFRVMDRYRHGLGFTNDPPQDILVVRDAAWYAMGASYLDAPFVAGMWDFIARHARHDGGKLTEYVRCALTPPVKEDDGLNINDDTPLWLWATRHHYALTRDRAWLDAVYPQVCETAAWILAQRRDGLVECTVSGTNVFGIASWRNIINGYQLNGAVTEINAACVAALRAAAELAEVLQDEARARGWREAADALATAIEAQLKRPDGLYALARNPDGSRRDEVTADLLFPLLFGVADAEAETRVIERLTRPDFWTTYGLRTVGRDEPEYDPAYGWGLMGGIWPNLTAWACYAFRKRRPDLLAEGMRQTYALSEMPEPVNAGRVVPGEFPEWFDGDTFESKGMAMSPWMPPTFVWLGLEGLAGLTPLTQGPRARLAPNLPPEWRWLGARNVSLGQERLAFFILDGTLHVAGAAVEAAEPVERYDAELTETIASDAPFTLALRRGDTLRVFVATDAPCVVRLRAEGEDYFIELGAGEARMVTVPVAARV